jgi:hypothetical protein
MLPSARACTAGEVRKHPLRGGGVASFPLLLAGLRSASCCPRRCALGGGRGDKEGGREGGGAACFSFSSPLIFTIATPLHCCCCGALRAVCTFLCVLHGLCEDAAAAGGGLAPTCCFWLGTRARPRWASSSPHPLRGPCFFCCDDAFGAAAFGTSALYLKNLNWPTCLFSAAAAPRAQLLLLLSSLPLLLVLGVPLAPGVALGILPFFAALPLRLMLVRLWPRARRRCSCSCCSPCCCSPLCCWAAWPWSPASRGIAHFTLAVCRAVFLWGAALV